MKKQIFCIMALAVAMTAKATVVTTINNKSDLQALATSVNGGADSYSGVTVTLTTDLDLELKEPGDVYWTPIGTTAHPFVGTFNGGGHTISNLKVDLAGSATGNVAGLFGQIGKDGVVKNVNINGGLIVLNTLSGVAVSEGVNCAVGSIAGYNNGTIVGCSNSAEVRGNWDYASAGGIAGENGSKGVIQNCYNLGEVYTDPKYTGNKLGGIAGENNHTIQNCFVKATISTVGLHGKICGNNGGSFSGCFYLNGTIDDVPYNGSPQPLALLDNESNSAALTTLNGETKHVLLSGRTLFADKGWNTICFPFDIPAGATGYSPIAGATVMTLSSSSFSAGTLTLTFADVTTIDGSIKAGKPYIVKWNKVIDDDLPNPVFLGVTVSKVTTNVTTDYTDFVGTYSPITWSEENRSILFLGNSNKLYFPQPSGGKNPYLNAFRTYFELKNGITAGDVAGTRMIFEDNETTGIIEAEANSSLFTHNSSLSDWFDLSGRKVSKPTTKGLYIHNGRKIVIK